MNQSIGIMVSVIQRFRFFTHHAVISDFISGTSTMTPGMNPPTKIDDPLTQDGEIPQPILNHHNSKWHILQK
jgi:hypothetical protein